MRLFVSAVAFLACGAAAQSQWSTVTIPPGFSVELPAKYRYEQKGPVHQYVVEINQRAFVVQGGTYAWSVEATDSRARLQAELDRAARDLDGGAWTRVTWTTLGELAAADAVGRRGDTVVRSFSTQSGAAFVALTYAGPLGTERAPEVERFIASLKRLR